MGWLFLLLAVASEAFSHVALKATDGLSHLIPNVIVITGHLGAFYFLSQAMKTLPVGIAHASWAGLAIIAVTLISSAFYHQHLDNKIWLGIGFISIGIALINLSSTPHVH
ncbi:QacE family quaternary ammonium compound efflux SMR transporter [Aliivibrio fischeri]|uniref:DMT family transporter n=1 Tax=Aliivibrio fischeri TaxID=668 RepID=UPI0012D891B8|nr:multidrug efflux SMR transporter [Aliivibrio fischeri]MUK62113.1 QacE family quaternary ammonium compound efflux SMR transporter [Aliivibrio fischeri]MUK75714.1 QacE family quaternary ammonium compound efflux SMR transporter [Aliivibrio fischeri]MUL21615.1 QacE family quaternary ammonium compound efflux SMR transporter [Aliivibrio fischeri]MUL23377.1 QacE family quaternary ammonium compound efflux SMR transporter [Aliivibrio fischeri]